MSTDLFKRPLLLMICALGVGLSACGEDKPWLEPDPKDAFRAFLLNWTIGKDAEVLAALAPTDRAQLEKTHATIVATLGDKRSPALKELFFASGVARTFDVKRIELEQPLPAEVKVGAKSTLKLSFHDGREGKAVMLWDGSRWCVLLGLDTKRV